MRTWLLACLLVTAACVKKDPLRAPWLLPGFYPAGRPAAPALEAVPAPTVLDAGGVLEAPARTDEVAGSLYGVDLRAYASVAVVIDTAAWACEGYHGDRGHPGPPAPHLAAMADQLYAALDGLDVADDRIAIFSGAEGHVRSFSPRGAGGRLAARDWVRGTVCGGHQAIAPLLREAFAARPDVVLVLSDGTGLRPQEQAFARRWCADDHDPLPCTSAADFARGAGDRRPVIAVSVAVPDSGWMKALADATGGTYVDASP